MLEAVEAGPFRKTPRDFRRSGPLSPRLLVMLLVSMAANAGRRGYGLLLERFWSEARTAGLDLPTERPVSAAALCQARQKLDAEAVRALVWRAAERFEGDWGERHRWRGLRVFAVDGSRANVQRSEALWERYGGDSKGGCPQVLLSTLFDVVSKVPHDVAVAPYGSDERQLLLGHLDRLRAGDLLVLDRGYPSFEVLCHLEGRGLDFAMRVRTQSGFPAVTRFVESGRRDGRIEITVPQDYRMKDVPPVSVRAVRIERRGAEPMVVLTSLPRRRFPIKAIRELYAMRWRIESYYQVVKGGYFGQGQFHAKTPDGVEQEVYAQALLVALSRHLMAGASATHAVPYEEVGEKAALLAVADDLTRLLLTQRPADAAALLEHLLDRIARHRVKPRPGRSYPRRSFKPASKWHARGKRGGPALA